LGFRSIRFHGFRNLEDGEIELGAHDVYLIGENGQGKTNFLEALYLLSFGSSFRTRLDRDLVTIGRKDMSVHGHFNVPGEPEGKISVIWKDGSKSIRLHGKTVLDRKDLLRRIPAIAFVHDDFLFAGRTSGAKALVHGSDIESSRSALCRSTSPLSKTAQRTQPSPEDP
jgi:DNA replication and repair protein RecF